MHELFLILSATILILELLIIQLQWYKKGKKSRIVSTVRLGFGMLLIWTITTLLSYFSSDIFTSHIFLLISDTAVILGAYFLTSTISLIIYSKYGLKRTVFFTILGTYQIMLNLLILIFIKFPVITDEILNIHDYFVFVIPIALFYLINHDYRKISNKTEMYENLELVTFKNSTYLLVLIIPIFIISIYLPNFIELIFYYLVIAIIVLENIIMLRKVDHITFFKGAKQFTLLIQKINSGLIFQKNFIEIEDIGYNNLLSNWLDAFSEIISQFLGQVKPIEIPIEENYKIHFSWGDHYSVAIVTDYTSPLLMPAIILMSEKVNNTLNGNLILNGDEQIMLDSYSQECFYFIKNE